MKRIVSLLLVLSVVFALGMTAMAAEEKAAPEAPKYTITINNTNDKHSYEAYQIFAATLSKDGTILSDVKWGTGVTEAGRTAMGDAAKKAEDLQTSQGGVAFSKEVEKYLDGTQAHQSSFAEGKHTIDNLESGYYLIKDKDNSVTGHDSYTLYIMQVVGNREVSPKSGVAQVEKKVKDINDTTGEMTGWQDSADYDVNDKIPFQLKATLAPNVDAYNTYKVVFHDTLSQGLTYNKDATVTINGSDFTSRFIINHDAQKNELTISCDDVKALEGTGNKAEVIVEYTATLNEKAVLGSKGNPNTVYLEFSNNPNYAGEAANSPMGKTPEDKVMIFTYQVEVNKVNEKDQPLQGAGFTLYKKVNNEFKPVGAEVKGETMTKFVWTHLDDGEYKLVETTTPDGYNTMKDVLFTISATHEENSENPALNTLTGGDTFTGAVDTGKLTAKIVNKPGVQLPSTGGVGTTIFYIAGGVLVLLSGVVLLTKKRSYEQA